jgi:hypothetical protein
MMKLQEGAVVVAVEMLGHDDSLRIRPASGKEKILGPSDLPTANRATKGKRLSRSIVEIGRVERVEEQG